MATVTKNTKNRGQYHQWGPSDMSNGDILDVWGSLGNREAHTVTIESLNGASTVRFNVVRRVYEEYGAMDQAAGMGQGLPRPAPTIVTEIEDELVDNIVIEDSSTHTWTSQEIGVRDIKIVSKSSGLKITVT